jgi:aspartyl-tRNA(Asn)/glutamyl-tRNA(Gln) amidotransferase subunit A
MIDLNTLTIVKARKALDSGEFSAVDLASAYLAEIEKKNPELNAYLEVYNDVPEQAKKADERIAKGEKAPLLGIPLAIKDNILIEGKRASSASKILENYVATYDATVIEKLKKQGAVFLGRTNMDEFAMGGSTENSAFGPTRNPADTSRVAGGSSGGSICAVAANLCLGALGSDTGGSVREPASFCGVVGLKPTYGKVSRYGLMALGSSLDCIGPVAKTVEDTGILFNAVSGADVLDGTTITPETYSKVEKTRKVIGVPWNLINTDGIDSRIKENFKESIQKLEGFGFTIKDISLPNIGLSLAVYYIIMPAEASSNLARFDGVKYGLHVDGGQKLLADYLKTRGTGFGPEPRRRILLGTYVLSSGYYDAYYNKALAARDLLKKEFARAFENVDIIATPTAPMPAWKIGEKNDPLSVYLADVFTVPANIVGIPAISVPSGSVDVGGKKLPLGIQFIASHAEEEKLFDISKKFLGE